MPDDLNRILKQTQRRTRQYWNVDGLPEIVIGGLFLLLGLYFLAQVALPPGSLLGMVLQASFVLIVVGGVGVGGRLLQSLKAQVTYPRTGFVDYPKPSRAQRWASAVIALAMGLLIAALLGTFPRSLDWMPALTGIIVAVIGLLNGYRLRIVRFYLLAGFSFLTGAALSLAGLGDLLGTAIYYSAMGVVLLLSGSLTLRSYLRSFPLPGNETA